MTFQEKEKYLKSYRSSLLAVKSYEQQIESLRSTMDVQGYQLSDMPRHHAESDKMADYAHRHMILYHKLRDAQRRAESVIQAINDLADTNPTGQYLLTCMFIKGMSGNAAGIAMNMSKPTRIKEYRKAVNMIQKRD